MRTIAITTEHYWAGEVDALVALLDRGYWRVHVRKPHSSVAVLEAFLLTIPEPYRERVSLHDGLELAVKHGFGGVHLSARHGQVPHGFKGMVSQSCHRVEEIVTSSDRDYCFLSPIFNSISKVGYTAAFTDEELREAAAAGIIGQKVFALGGVTPERFAQIAAWQFGGAALLGAAWREFNVQK